MRCTSSRNPTSRKSSIPKSGAPVADGETGELVLTTLGREATPLLRYRTGDLVRQTRRRGLCPRRRNPRRTDDMLVVRGVNIFPSAVDAVVRALPEVARISRPRHAQRRDDRTRASRSKATTTPRLLRLAAKLTESFTLRIPVTRVATGTLPRFDFKARRWGARFRACTAL